MTNYASIRDIPLKDKVVLIRADMNVPLHEGKISDDSRIQASLPTVRYALKEGAAVILMTHLGRPKEGRYEKDLDGAPIAQRLSELLKQEVLVVQDWQSTSLSLPPGQVVLLQNVRFNPGEKENDSTLGAAYAALADIFVNDAFGTAHRSEASTHAVAQHAKIAVAGLLLDSELKQLARALDDPKKPVLAIVGGSKVSTKLSILKKLGSLTDYLIVGGGIANTFLLAEGKKIGASLAEKNLVSEALAVKEALHAQKGEVLLPVDVVVAKEIKADATIEIKSVKEVGENDLILDIGPKTREKFAKVIEKVKTLIWNGPVGMFELPPFAEGTRALSQAIAKSNAFTIAGGGDTLAAIKIFAVGGSIDYISTGGGAFLEYLQGHPLPAVQALIEARDRHNDL
ncbi:MAG: phosphoglycerate kinase [Haemophilus parainfluenzae]|jgi:phosphoglycerate kinase|nr:MAG: phosphoglycerate kinase [Haemophilus parainfluenzae]